MSVELMPWSVLRAMWALGWLVCASVTQAQSGCPVPLKKAVNDMVQAGQDADAPLRAVDQRPADEQLQSLAQAALRRSAQIGAQRLLAEAAELDLQEVIARARPQASLSATVGPSVWSESGGSRQQAMALQTNVNVMGVLYDGGRQQQLASWRQQLSKAARAGFFQAQEQVVLEAVSTALERNRYRMQGQVFQQHVRKMACLVSMLEEIVAEDRGRASELNQARKSLAQAELSRDSALALSRQLEVRLTRYVGDDAVAGDGIAGALTQVLDSGEVLRKLDQGYDFQALRAQVQASEHIAQVTAAARDPQLNWVVTNSGTWRGDDKSASVQAGVSLSYNLFDGGASDAASLAAARRAEAARFQYEEFTNLRVSRVGELHEAAMSAFDRARRLVDVLRQSDKVRQATLQQWSQLGRRSLFDVMSTEGDHFNLRVAYVNALYDGYQANSQMRSLGGGMLTWVGQRLP